MYFGQKLVVSGSTAVYHTVKKGNTVSKLAEEYGSDQANKKLEWSG